MRGIAPRITATLALASALFGQATTFAGLPGDLRDRLVAFVGVAKELGYQPKERYVELLASLRGELDAAAASALLRDLVQLGFDHDAPDAILTEVLRAQALPAMRSIAAECLPAEVEVWQFTLKNGSVITGTAGPLERRWDRLTAKQLDGQWYFEPNYGLAGLGNWHVVRQDVAERKRVKVRTPRAICLGLHSDRVDEKGRLHADGEWLRAGGGRARETVVLEAVTIGSGGTIFVSSDLGVQAARPTHFYKNLIHAAAAPKGLAAEVGWQSEADVAAAAAEDAANREAEKLRQLWSTRIAKWRSKVADLDWPKTFDPLPDRLRTAKFDEALFAADPRLALLRLRLHLTYGDDAPEWARQNPSRLFAMEASLRKVLGGSAKPESLDDSISWLDWMRVVRHLPDFAVPPKSGLQPGGYYLRLPKGYGGWRAYPLLVVLHGQYSRPDYDFGLWSEHADAAGCILVCPRFGSESGAPRSQADDRKVLDVVRRLALRLHVDPDRIYLTGLSMGGAKSWTLASCYTGRWAAVAPEIHGPAYKHRRRAGAKVEFPLVPNLRALPLFILEGQFDGLNTVNARAAVKILKRLRAPVTYYEAALIGHERMAWRYPSLLRSFAATRREAHPTRVAHRSFHSWNASHAWLRINKIKRPLAFAKTDGGYGISDLAGIEGRVQRDTIRVHRTVGGPREVEVFYDPVIMPAQLKLRIGSTRSVKWQPLPSTTFMIRQLLETGDRSRLYPASRRCVMK